MKRYHLKENFRDLVVGDVVFGWEGYDYGMAENAAIPFGVDPSGNYKEPHTTVVRNEDAKEPLFPIPASYLEEF